MAKIEIAFVCQSCGAAFAKWAGRCEACGEWNSLVEENQSRPALPGGGGKKSSRAVTFEPLNAPSKPLARFSTGLAEFDRVCGGGIVPGAAMLIGGDPGIGKSTLLLQAAALAARQGRNIAYISGEEATAQIQDRARRLSLADAPVNLASETELGLILASIAKHRPDLVIIDSIQTLWSDALPAAPGTVAQVRACAHELVREAKKSGSALVLVGHVTKDGQVAGPKVVEHLVDAVLQFEGERGHQFRILRAQKNRFGPADEIGVFEMTERGLAEVANPSALFLDPNGSRASGAAVFAGLEGARPILVEIQALAAPAAFGTPRRSTVGWDSARLATLLAVLDTRCGLGFATRDVYLSVAGGLRLSDPAADLAVAAALVSAHVDMPLPKDMVVFGEVALSGDVRPAGRLDVRLREAAKLGFRQALAAPGKVDVPGVEVIGLERLAELVVRAERGGWR